MNYCNLVVNYLGPMFVLIILNCLIYKALKRNNSTHSSTRSENGIRRNVGQSSDALRKRDVRLTRISIIIVIVFILCHFPRIIPNVAEMAEVVMNKVNFLRIIDSNLLSYKRASKSS